jgi:hypothetical protein
MRKEHEQPHLPGFESLMGEESAKPRRLIPRVSRHPSVDVHDLLYHPLDINFRARLGIWIKNIETDCGFRKEDILKDRGVRLINSYLCPQDTTGVWLNQEDVWGDTNVAKFRKELMEAVVKIYRRSKVGEDAIEVLKPDRFLWKSLIRYHKHTITSIKDASGEELIKICGARIIFNDLVGLVRAKDTSWSPPRVVFPQELSPDVASRLLFEESISLEELLLSVKYDV